MTVTLTILVSSVQFLPLSEEVTERLNHVSQSALLVYKYSQSSGYASEGDTIGASIQLYEIAPLVAAVTTVSDAGTTPEQIV
jgi:hypothetical protein